MYYSCLLFILLSYSYPYSYSYYYPRYYACAGTTMRVTMLAGPPMRKEIPKTVRCLLPICPSIHASIHLLSTNQSINP